MGCCDVAGGGGGFTGVSGGGGLELEPSMLTVTGSIWAPSERQFSTKSGKDYMSSTKNQ